jgi:hypothetical protein
MGWVKQNYLAAMTDCIMYVCMYIVGEGLKRPQHRDHPWSILTDCILYNCSVSCKYD